MPEARAQEREAVHHPSSRHGGVVLLLFVLGVIPLLGGCSATTAAVTAKPDAVKVVKDVRDGGTHEIILTAKAAERLGIKTSPVVAGPADSQLAIPYSSLLYDPDGKTFVYTRPQELVFRRADVSVVQIMGGTVVLATGPPVGTAVVTVGAAELFGVDTGVGGGH